MDFTRRTIVAGDHAPLMVWDTCNEGIPVVFVHGFPETHISWNPVIRKFDSSEIRDYRLIAYDLRGFGESSKTGEASLTRFYYDHDTIVSQLQLKRYHLVGHDWGGALALHVARYKPESLLSLSILNTNYWKTDVLGMWHMLFFNLPFLPAAVFRLFPSRVFYFGLHQSFVDLNRLSHETRDVYRQMFQENETTQYWTRLYRTMGRSLLARFFPAIKRVSFATETAPLVRSKHAYQTPIQLIWGAEDRFNPVWVCRDMEKRLKMRGARVSATLVADAGHFVQEEQPGQVASCLLEHWQRIGRC